MTSPLQFLLSLFPCFLSKILMSNSMSMCWCVQGIPCSTLDRGKIAKTTCLSQVSGSPLKSTQINSLYWGQQSRPARKADQGQVTTYLCIIFVIGSIFLLTSAYFHRHKIARSENYEQKIPSLPTFFNEESFGIIGAQNACKCSRLSLFC